MTAHHGPAQGSTSGEPATAPTPVPTRAPAAVDGTAAAETMTALVQDHYGSADVLRLAEVATPALAPGTVLVRVRATSVNARDWHLMRGEPRIARTLDRNTFGRSAPRERIRGTDFAGTVVAIGDGVTRWRPGDAVFGESDGAIADYVAAAEDVTAAIPPGATFEEAAAVPLAANTALTCLRAGNPKAGDTILINGASGGVGTFAVQLATWMGLYVTAVYSTRNADLVRSEGAETIIDYTQEDFSVPGRRPFDLILDLVGNRTLKDLRRVLRPSGTLVLSGGGVPGRGRVIGPFAMMVEAKLTARLTRLRVSTPLAKPSSSSLDELAGLWQSGAFTPVIDRTFPFHSAPEAIRYMETEHPRAKVVITHGSGA